MTIRSTLLLATILLLVAGCSDDSGTNPPGTPPEDWTFTPDSTKFSATLVVAKDTMAAGEAFDVLLVLYNVPDVFGMSTEFTYTPNSIDVLDVIAGPHFSPAGNTLVVKNIEATASRVSFGVTFKRGTSTGVSGSGAVMKLKCRGRAAGAAGVNFNVSRFEVVKADGTPVANFGTLQPEDVALIIR
jgi:hypothetical protein